MANDRDCENCKHHKEVCKNGIFYHSCESWDCEFEPKEDEEFEPKEDAISRQAVLEQAMDYGSNTYLIPVNSVKALPPVNPQKPCKDCQYKEWLEGEDLPQKPICPSAGVDCEDCPASSSEKPNKWIPVSKRLPEDFGTYLITLEGGDVCKCEFNPDFIDEEHENGAFTYYHQYFDQATLGMIDEEEEAVDAIAWMPFEPYKAEGGDKE